MYDASYSCCDGDEGVYFPTVVLESANKWVVFSVFMAKDLVKESIMVVGVFYKLNCVYVGGDYGCLALVWGSYYPQDAKV